MIDETDGNIARFGELVELAESGELQDAEDRVGPFNVNPYYYEGRDLVAAAGLFMNCIVPEMQEWQPEDGDGLKIDDMRQRYMERTSTYTHNREALASAGFLADKAGYLVRINEYVPGDSSTVFPIYQPTKRIMDLEQNDVFVGKHTLKIDIGCLPMIGAGAVGTVFARSVVEASEQTVPSFFIVAGLLGGLGLGGVASRQYRNLRAGTEAYRYYSGETAVA